MIEILFTPSCWFRYFKINTYWDTKLNIILDCSPEIEVIDSTTVLINSIKVCTFEYAYGARHNTWFRAWPGDRILPSRSTCMRLKKILEDYRKHNLDFV